MEAAAVARNDGVGLAGVEDHHRTPDQRDAMPCDGKVHVQSPVLAEEQVAKGSTAIVGCVVVVPRATTGHQRHVAGGQHIPQTECARPVGCRLHAVLVVWPAGSRTRKGQDLDVSGFQTQALRYVPFPIGDQPCRRRWDVDHTGQHGMAHAAAVDGVIAPEKRREAVWRRMRLWRAAHQGQCTQGRVRYFVATVP